MNPADLLFAGGRLLLALLWVPAAGAVAGAIVAGLLERGLGVQSTGVSTLLKAAGVATALALWATTAGDRAVTFTSEAWASLGDPVGVSGNS